MTAYVFPGQGSQEPGMGKELYEAQTAAREVFDIGAHVTGRDLTALCFQSDAGALARTENAQLAVFTVSMAVYAVLRLDSENQTPAVAAGFSLGECSALCAAGVLSLEDGFRLVQKRAVLMQKACTGGNGAMSALLGGDPPAPFDDNDDWAQPVNFNCPGQTVIAGTPRGVEVLEERCKASGGRVARLALSGAFHTKAMGAAGAELRTFAETLTFRPPALPVYTNLTGAVLPPDTDIPRHLEAQMTNPVLWQRSIENMIASGVTQFVEMGHGKSLQKLIKRIDRNVEVT